jgi:heptosyltransferase-1
MLSQILQSFGYLTVRGSSTRGGKRGLIEMIKYARKGYSPAFAADGPKGPYHKLKSGLVYAAQKTGMPVIPINCSPKNKIILKKTWDKTIIPLPFSKTIQIYGEPIYINKDDNINNKTAFVEERVNKLSEFINKYYWSKDILKYLEYHPAPKILIVQPSRLGDIVFSLPTLSAIKKKYPYARLSWIVDERCFEILEGNPFLEKIFIWDRRQKSIKYYIDLMKSLRRQKFDLSIDLHGLAKSAMLVKLAGAKFKIASSSTNGMREFSWLFSKEIKSSSHHCVERHFKVAKYLGCCDNINYPIYIPEESFRAAKDKLTKENVNLEKIVGIHPGGGWISRRWGTSKYAGLSKRLNNELHANVVLVGGKEGGSSERGINEEIVSESNVNITDMTGKFTLKELCAFLKMCKVFVGNEAGPIHIATALNVQTVAILGPTDANRTGPYKGNTKIIQHKFDCQPCRNRNCVNLKCMQAVSVDDVFEEVKKKYL